MHLPPDSESGCIPVGDECGWVLRAHLLRLLKCAGGLLQKLCLPTRGHDLRSKVGSARLLPLERLEPFALLLALAVSFLLLELEGVQLGDLPERSRGGGGKACALASGREVLQRSRFQADKLLLGGEVLRAGF